LQAFARTRAGGWLFINVFRAIDRWLIPRTHGRLRLAMGQPILLLHTRGAKSGQLRSTPLLYTPHDKGFIIVASKAGATHHSAWYHKIRAHPEEVAVELGGCHISVRPHVVEEPERSELWRRVNDNYNGYETYEQRAGGRIIPIATRANLTRSCEPSESLPWRRAFAPATRELREHSSGKARDARVRRMVFVGRRRPDRQKRCAP
jgi:deazaflavin-dependent oxidoreductase (nitroreductase family)